MLADLRVQTEEIVELFLDLLKDQESEAALRAIALGAFVQLNPFNVKFANTKGLRYLHVS